MATVSNTRGKSHDLKYKCVFGRDVMPWTEVTQSKPKLSSQLHPECIAWHLPASNFAVYWRTLNKDDVPFLDRLTAILFDIHWHRDSLVAKCPALAERYTKNPSQTNFSNAVR